MKLNRARTVIVVLAGLAVGCGMLAILSTARETERFQPVVVYDPRDSRLPTAHGFISCDVKDRKHCSTENLFVRGGCLVWPGTNEKKAKEYFTKYDVPLDFSAGVRIRFRLQVQDSGYVPCSTKEERSGFLVGVEDDHGFRCVLQFTTEHDEQVRLHTRQKSGNNGACGIEIDLPPSFSVADFHDYEIEIVGRTAQLRVDGTSLSEYDLNSTVPKTGKSCVWFGDATEADNCNCEASLASLSVAVRERR